MPAGASFGWPMNRELAKANPQSLNALYLTAR